MKPFMFVILLIGSFLTSCTSQLTTLPDGKKLDTRLTGMWAGSEKDQQIEGVEKKWEMNRKPNGEYTINFTFTNDEGSANTKEEGKWWVADGKYYEFHSYDNKTDVYSYSVLDPTHVKFKTINMSVEVENPEYEFIDTKVGESKMENASNEESFKNAIKVKSVPEEYEYVQNDCPDCELKFQALTEHNGRYYDIIRVVTKDGTEKSYYFDITSFYGKNF